MMKSVKDWVLALGVRKEDFATWARMAPSQDSFTFWCIDSGKVDGGQYLDWAREHFGLASLNSDFFETDPNLGLWQKIETVANWSAELVPVGEWDNTIFIACVEPRPDVQWSFPVRYVLALPHDLKKFWANLQKKREKSFSAIRSVPIQQEASVIIAPAPSAPIPNPIVLTPPAPPVQANEPTVHLVDTEEPAGLNLSVMKSKPAVKERDYLAELASEVKKTGAEANFSGPDNLNWQPKPAHDDSAIAPEGIVLTFKQNPAPPPVVAPSHEMAVAPSPAPIVIAPAPTAATEPAPPIMIEDNDAELSPDDIETTVGGPFEMTPVEAPIALQSEGTNIVEFASEATQAKINFTFTATNLNGQPATTTTTAPATPKPLTPPPIVQTTNTGSVAPSAPPPISSASGGGAIARYMRLIPEFKMTFEGGMVVEIRNDNFIPICWDESFKPASPTAQRVWNLNPPSAFRVAFRTGLPYLGQIIETPLNREFFTAWGFSALPKVLLVRPIKNGSAITHLIVCISNGVKKNHLLLSEGDRLAEIFNELLNQKMAA